MSSLQLLLDDEKMSSDNRHEVVNGALSCGEGLLHTLNDILTIAKSKYIVSLSLLAFSTVTLLYDAVSAMKPFAMRRGVLLSQQQHLVPAVKDGFEVDTMALSQVKGDVTVIMQVSAGTYLCTGHLIVYQFESEHARS
jgi:signal transduction histidine kinase